jgi:hypothetical protein
MMTFLCCEAVIPLPPFNHRVENYPFLGIRDCLFSVLAATLLIVESISSTCNVRKCHMMVTWDPHNILLNAV